MQAICSRTRVPAMTPILLQHLARSADVEAIIALLQYVHTNYY